MSDTHSMQADLSIVCGSTLQVLYSSCNVKKTSCLLNISDHPSGQHANIRKEVQPKQQACHLQSPADKAGTLLFVPYIF